MAAHSKGKERKKVNKLVSVLQRKSLREAALLLAGSCLAVFAVIFLFVFSQTMPEMLLTIETKYLQDQTEMVVERFHDLQQNAEATALDIGAWNETVEYVSGRNSYYVADNWPGASPAAAYQYNFIIIKDAAGQNVYTEFYDYINDQLMSAPPGLTGRLTSFAIDVTTRNRHPRPEGTPYSEFGKSGLFFYDGVPYLISVMPVMPGRWSGGAVGAVILGIIVDNDYFVRISKYADMQFSWERTSIYLQSQTGEIVREGTAFVAASVPMTDIYENPAQLFMSGPRQIYTQGEREIFSVGAVMIVLVCVLAVSLYYIIDRMFLRPMEKLNAGITGISTSGTHLDVGSFSRTREFEAIGSAINDMTDRLNQSALLQEAYERAEQASRAKSAFLSRMSHEMRTPMNAIIGMTSIARQADDIARKEYCLNKIEEASTHLLGVINDILDVSKIEAGKFELSYTSFDFKTMITRVADVIQFRVEEKRQNLSVNIDEAVPAAVFSDEQHLAQVVTNLLSNAVKFTPEGGDVALTIRVVSNAEESFLLQLTVKDTGIGVNPDQQARLFESFEQADGGIGRKFGGTGLGLAISKNIVELMGGSIWVESELGKGATFIVELPIEKAPAEALQDTPTESLHAEPGDDEAGCFVGYRLLLAEDVDINREIVAAFLEHTGIELYTAEDGAEAVEMFREAPEDFDAILMDIHMPEIDGYEATRRIRALPAERAKTIPIIAMTANVFREDIEKCLEAGMNDHIGKPLDAYVLLAKLKKYLTAE